MDPETVEILRIVLGSAAVSAVVSGVISEWRARAAAKRAVEREEAAERRSDERERKRDRRDIFLRQLDDTEGDYLGSMDWLMYRSMGSQEHMDATRWGESHWPHAQWYLLGDEALLDQAFAFRMELQARPFGAGFDNHDAARMGALQGHVRTRLDAQRERVRNGEEPLWPRAAWVKSFLDRAGAQFGVPPEYQPKIKDD